MAKKHEAIISLRRLINSYKIKIFNDFRLKRIFLTGITALVSKIITALVQLISIPLAIKYLGVGVFGVIMTIINTVTTLALADLGLGFGIQTLLPSSVSKQDTNEINKIISNAFFMLVFSASTFLFVFFIINNREIDWVNLLGLNTNMSAATLQKVIIVIVVSFLIGLPFVMVQRIYSVYQEGYYNEIWSGVAKMSSLFILWLAIMYDWKSSGVVFAFFSIDYIFIVLSFIMLFSFVKPYLRISVRYFDKKTIIALTTSGMFFFVLQAASILVNLVDSFLILKYVGANSSALYAISMRVITLMALPIQIFSLSTLSAYNDAFVNQEFGWIKSTLRTYFKMTAIISIILAILFSVFSNMILHYWIGNEIIYLSPLQNSIFAVLLINTILNAVISYISLSNFLYKFVFKVYPFVAILCICCKLISIHFFGGSIELIVGITIIIPTLFYFLPVLYKLRQQNLI